MPSTTNRTFSINGHKWSASLPSPRNWVRRLCAQRNHNATVFRRCSSVLSQEPCRKCKTWRSCGVESAVRYPPHACSSRTKLTGATDSSRKHRSHQIIDLATLMVSSLGRPALQQPKGLRAVGGLVSGTRPRAHGLSPPLGRRQSVVALGSRARGRQSSSVPWRRR